MEVQKRLHEQLEKVNRSGWLENNATQYPVLSLDEDQLQQILYLYDYLYTCQLREKYG
ncbi:hypothetical protein Lser_V15G32907 [Lactuca serriola]